MLHDLAEIEEKHAQELVDVKRKHQRGKETIEVHCWPVSQPLFCVCPSLSMLFFDNCRRN